MYLWTMSKDEGTELSLASDAEVRKWDERDRADEEYFMMLEKAAIMRESADEQLLIKKPWSERFWNDKWAEKKNGESVIKYVEHI